MYRLLPDKFNNISPNSVFVVKEITIKIDDGVLQKTTKCKHDFSCLSENKKCLCDVVDSIGEDIVEIKEKPTNPCNYLISLKNSHYCHCPTRNEIYNRYRI